MLLGHSSSRSGSGSNSPFWWWTCPRMVRSPGAAGELEAMLLEAFESSLSSHVSCCLLPHRMQEIHIAEIDAGVIEASKRYFPGMSIGFSDLRVTVNVCDGIKFVQDAAEGSYDVIIVDSSDPVGPAEVLFQQVSAWMVSLVTGLVN
eukprot:GHUV01040772.1.p1 GENE.GHUV01040772.1~~GHUV01040772.1.p1  ORF type:complete len:147 (-),score=38.74 GHUV01040772.1:84-524(-)